MGLMIGIACRQPRLAHALTRSALERGVLVLPSGEGGRVVSITPPLSIDEALLDHGLSVLVELVRELEQEGVADADATP